ncbi:hypothetical protein SAMN05443144_10316 [Fodinibius roseus]|uniref:Uncharacterized protein n=1 Tax=Fodinibius roseus TaxID=1194090 RepID=A0A1M4VRU5_9BACT|nr:hypothetical protein SAMN05443144_10316 [Fodinibius roseus]
MRNRGLGIYLAGEESPWLFILIYSFLNTMLKKRSGKTLVFFTWGAKYVLLVNSLG